MLQHYIGHRPTCHAAHATRPDDRRERAHILEGLTIVLDNLDETIAIIRGAQDEKSAQTALEQRFNLSEASIEGHRRPPSRPLTRLESGKLREEYEELIKKIAQLEDLLANPRLIDASSRTRSPTCAGDSPIRGAARSVTTSSR